MVIRFVSNATIRVENHGENEIHRTLHIFFDKRNNVILQDCIHFLSLHWVGLLFDKLAKQSMNNGYRVRNENK
jgi:hypothetical protein